MLGVALLSSIPMYADGVIQRLLIRDIERHQDETGSYPGIAKLEVDLYALRERTQRAPYVEAINKDLNDRLVPALRVPLIAKMRQLRMDHLYDLRLVKNGNKKVFARVEAIEHIERHSTITHGRMFKPNNRTDEQTTVDNGKKVYEAIVTEEAFWKMNLQLNKIYQLNDLVGQSPRLKIEVVGIFEKSDPQDLFWFTRFSQLSSSYLIDFSDFEEDFLWTETRNLTRAYWYFAINYHELKIHNIQNIMRRHSEYQRLSNPREIRFRLPITQLLEKYLERAANLRNTITFLQIPSILIVFLFVAMLSQMLIDADRSDIKVLKSRGASKNQLLIAYIFESTILGFLGLILGIPLAILIVRVMGSSNGFLDFVNRPPLDILITWKILAFSLAGLLIFMGSLIIPLITVTRTSLSKKSINSSELEPSTTWKRYMIDVFLIGIAGYAFFSFQHRYKIQNSISEDPLPLDPLLFIASTIFILGMALFSLRLFPIVINFIFKIGARFWSPIIYSGMIQISRSSDRERFAMMFLILTLGVGLVSSITARTINQSYHDNISFEIGADIVLEPEFLNDSSIEDGEIDSMDSSTDVIGITQSVQFQAPPLELFSNLPGVQHLTTVYRNSSARMIIPGNIRTSIEILAINPYEFGRIAWFRDDLLPKHIHTYLNLLGNTNSGILLSTYARDNIGIKIGDLVQISWKGQPPLHMYVLGFIDHWPSFGYGASSIFGVSNFQYVFSRMATEPYELWMQLSEETKRSPFYSALVDREIDIIELRDTAQLNILAKNDPLLQGTNGVLTFSFFTATVVTLTGYVLFLVFSLRKRTLQFGLIRALGLHRRQVIVMLIIEQIIVGGYSIIAGLIIGQIASVLYVPFLQLAGSIKENILPFQVVALRSDYLRFYLLSLFIIIIGGLIFQSSVRQLRMHEALKLGDD